jgi:hypothetical protein
VEGQGPPATTPRPQPQYTPLFPYPNLVAGKVSRVITYAANIEEDIEKACIAVVQLPSDNQIISELNPVAVYFYQLQMKVFVLYLVCQK